MKNQRENLDEPIGEGSEKRVFADPNNPDRVIARYDKNRLPESPEKIKARYYLTKLLHYLYPNNIPDIHAVHSEPRQDILQRKPHSERHTRLQQLRKVIFDSFARSGYDPRSVPRWADKEYGDLFKQVASDDHVRNLYEAIFVRTGVLIDASNHENFSEDENGNLLYLDSLNPWSYLDGELQPLFDIEKLNQAIASLDDERRKKAKKWLERLRVLENQETEQLK